MWHKRTKINLTQTTGISLIELLIAMAIGLVITSLSMNYLTSNIQTRNVNAAYSTLKDNGAVALHFLAHYTRSAGLQTIPIYGDSSITAGACETTDILCTRENITAPDRLSIRKKYPDDMQACNGQMASKGEELLEIFSHIKTKTYSALACQSYSLSKNIWLGTEEPRILQTGIEDFQVLYYQKNTAAALTASQVTHWNEVEGIEVAVLANSELPAHIKAKTQKYQVLNRAEQEFNDQFARQIFQTTIAFNNALLNEK